MDPLTWVWLALLAAGTGAQAVGQHKTDKAQAAALNEEETRRKMLQARNDASVADSQAQLLAMKDKEKQRADELAAGYQSPQLQATDTSQVVRQTGAPDPNAPPTGATSNIVGAENIVNRQNAYNATLAKLRGQLGGFGIASADAARAAARNEENIRQNGISMGNWNQQVLPAALAAAGQAGQGWNTTGDILKLAAAIVGPAALSKAGEGATAGQTAGEQITAARYGQDAATASKAFTLNGTEPIPAFGSSYGLGDAAIRAYGLPAATGTASQIGANFVQPSANEMSNWWGMYDPYQMLSLAQRRRQSIPVAF